ncbi:hypothetical protein HRbin22_01871 [Candidatus Thermoflexus japonica]|uniref:Uncharacterized protein n=1 Tax=Candidatus Thermoflexus japonica TaxID=2035417 RepID=A0A2H5Y833_9CHLR|nr:hypothetical protein HRbin22_01871 [Candidatus Thermoflexus japonica]
MALKPCGKLAAPLARATGFRRRHAGRYLTPVFFSLTVWPR